MKVENHILDILQLYEFAMALGKSLDYKESCDGFLKLLLKRKHYNAAWILEVDDKYYTSAYAIPAGNEIYLKRSERAIQLLVDIEDSTIKNVDKFIKTISPIKIDAGKTAIFNLKGQGYLFLYSKTDNIVPKDLSQLAPVISKFSVQLKACNAFKAQKKLLQNLETQNRELSDYAHMVSHDLKSPLRSIDTLSAWLREDYADKLGQSGSQQLDQLRASVEKMDTLISGILDYSTIGKNQSETYSVNLNTVLNDVVNTVQIPEHVEINSAKLPSITGDKLRLRQLFQNLLSNAIKHNDKAQALIDIKANESEDFWEFQIEDNGKGIEAQYFDKIFNAFEKLENNQESTGIGLSIVKKIVNLYGGKIWLTSKVGVGSTFYFTLKK